MPRIAQIDLAKIRSRLRGRSAEAARVLGMTPESLSRKLRGHHKLTLEELNALALFLCEDADTFLILTHRSTDARENVMQEERIKILKRFEAREISLEDAEQLLNELHAQEEESASTGEQVSWSNAEPVLPQLAGRPKANKLSVNDMIRLRDHDVEPRWIKGLYEIGLQDLPVDAIIQLADHEVELDWLRELQNLGLNDLSVKSIIALAKHDVDVDWLRQLREAGITDLSVEQIIQLAEHDVDVDLVKQLREAGITNLSAEQIIQLADHDVGADWLKEMRGLLETE